MATKQKAKNKRKSYSAHIKSSLVYIAPHAHTGKRLNRHHTSHGALLIFLVLAGIILFFSLATLDAAGITRNGHINLTATVPGAPPTVGAKITTPGSKSSVKNSLAVVTGTCPEGTTASVYNNGNFSSSNSCTPDNTFQTTIQLSQGLNTIQAQNYDVLNQAGPATDQVVIAYEPENTTPPIEAKLNTASDIRFDASIPTATAPQPSENPCFDEPASSTSQTLTIWASCVTRNVFVGEKLQFPINLSGGIGPYALSVDWGENDAAEVFSFSATGHHVLSHTFKLPQVKSISLHLADATGATYQMQTVVEVNNTTIATQGSSNPVSAIINEFSATWFEASVPVYWAAVTLFFGFWIGDIFQQTFGKKRIRRAHA